MASDLGLVIPMDVVALCVGEPDRNESVLAEKANFSRVPYYPNEEYNEDDIVNTGPYISASVLGETTTQLPVGIHLHWALPDALTAGIHNEQTGQTDFPLVPNRWLVTRIISTKRDNSQVISHQSWVIESDHLSKDDPNPEIDLSKVTVPVYPEDADLSNGDYGRLQSFRYLGKVFDYENWREGTGQEYVGKERTYTNPKLEATCKLITAYQFTAVGYGELTFASFYPNCCNVFGFYDSAEKIAAADYDPANHQLSYHVVGWFSDVNDDPLRKHSFELAPPPEPMQRTEVAIAAYREAYGKYLKAKLKLQEGEAIAYCEALKWCYSPDGTNKPGYSLYSGIVKGILWDTSKAYFPQDSLTADTQVVVANNTPEAISALLAKNLAQPALEPLLNALQMGVLDTLEQPGGLAQVKHTIHRNHFSADRGGLVWEIAIKEQEIDSDSQTPQTAVIIDETLSTLLRELNTRQWQADELNEEIRSLRQQIYIDWHKYQYFTRTEHFLPSEGLLADWLDNDEDAIEKVIDLIDFQINDWSEYVDDLRIDYLNQKLATLDRLNGEIAQYKTNLETELQKPEFSQYKLQETPGPGYWQPNEPLILLSGPAVAPPPRYGEDGRLRADGYLECRLTSAILSFSKPTLATQTALPNFSALAALVAEAGGVSTASLDEQQIPAHEIAIANWSDNLWIPMLLKWEVDNRPLTKLEPDHPNYDVDFIKRNYQLDADNLDLIPKHESYQSSDTYEGITLLSAGATIDLKQQIDEYLEYLPDDSEMEQRLRELQQQVKNSNLLCQSLSGFNQTLIAREQTLQFPVSDPLWGFEDDKDFALDVREAVDTCGDLAGLPHSDYSPIRAGYLSLSRLILIDTFGRMLEVGNVNNPIIAESLVPKVRGLQNRNFISLSPRLVPPSRLLFRWLLAESENQEIYSEADGSPVCGWIMFNRLDNSLMIYSSQAKLLGSLNLSGDESRIIWQTAPGNAETWDQSIETVLANENPYLRDFILKINQKQAGFLDSLLQTIDRTLTLVLPQSARNDSSVSVMIDRPLALVRTSLKLDLQGLPPVNQSWSEFRQVAEKLWELDDPAWIEQSNAQGWLARSTANFEAVQFPVHLGNLTDINDGLIGYFIGNNYDRFYAAAADGSHADITPPAQDTLLLSSAPQDASQILTLLIDPRAKVHATTAILPTEAIALPTAFYTQALKSIEANFLTAPILSRLTELALPIPQENQKELVWSWVEQDHDRWRTVTDIARVDTPKAVSYNPQTLREGWLRLSRIETSQ
ncbi:hypothetical protein [Scytonema sp. PCC 10023]|uniref:hypothetical protein n=1 Tax=Scytonema sp. PCC 10023 TaxID=1680591 RepID=UPI0039C737A5